MDRLAQAGRSPVTNPLIMGILNVTPDSFSDGGINHQCDVAISAAQRMIDDGADIIDVGGESTRPGAAPVGVDEELDRVIPVIEQLSALGTPVSIDTSKPEVMREAVAAGACLINDVRALSYPGALEAAAELDTPVCLMHMRGEPGTMQDQITYLDVINEVYDFLSKRVQACVDAGIDRDVLLIDPGFGFGKSATHNLSLLRELKQFSALGLPLLVGLSRKSVFQHVLGLGVHERLTASVAAALIAIERGASVVRVHDVRETAHALGVYRAVMTTTVNT